MSQHRERPWPAPAGPDRLPPRECIRNAQEEMNKAWCADDYDAAMIFVRGSVDWLRRALEQMAPEDAPCPE